VTAMDTDLTVAAVLRRAEHHSPARAVVGREPDRSLHHTTWGDTARRARRLAAALLDLGLEPGTRVASLCWSHHQHLELYYGVPMAGLVLHPLNPRLHPADIAWIIGHAGNQVLVVDHAFLGLLDRIRSAADGPLPLRHVIVVDRPAGTSDGVTDYESLLTDGDPDVELPAVDEHATALLGYTSGTTGRPKGVEVPHRALVIHALSSALPGWLAIRDTDVVMPVVPMYHALAWGWPYTSALLGAGLVLPGPFLDPASLLELLESQQVTLTGGVPTVWTGLLRLLDTRPGARDLTALRGILSGGSTAPPTMIDGYRDRHGLTVVHTWGMTELIMGLIAEPGVDELAGTEEQQRHVRRSQGRPIPLLEIRSRADGAAVPWDGESLGELEVRGPWVARSYIDAPEASAEQWTADGWFRTGDIVTIDPRGYVRIADRAKDVVKSGGEWISTPELENAILRHPDVAEAAVIGIADEKWGERPLAVVVPHPGHEVHPDELSAFIAPLVARWWLPERIVISDDIPKTAVGKIDKKRIRASYDTPSGTGS
jgi:fatty-acyl-CoA synthase